MASVDVSVSSDLTPEQAWALASDLDRFDEWLTIFGGWKSPVPDVIEKGTTVSSLIKVKGFRNTIHWEVTDYDAPKRIELCGSGLRRGTDIPEDGDRRRPPRLDVPPGRRPVRAHCSTDRSARSSRACSRSDVERSVQNLAALGADAV